MGQGLIGRLSLTKVTEFHKASPQLLGRGHAVLFLLGLNLRNQGCQFASGPVDGVDFLSDEELEPVGWALLRREPAGGYRTGFALKS